MVHHSKGGDCHTASLLRASKTGNGVLRRSLVPSSLTYSFQFIIELWNIFGVNRVIPLTHVMLQLQH
jgi:hypothetical protein